MAEKIGCYKVSASFPSSPNSPLLSFPHLPGHHKHLLSPSQTPPLTTTPIRQQTILDCSETNEGFYVKCGYKRAGLEMSHYYESKSS